MTQKKGQGSPQPTGTPGGNSTIDKLAAIDTSMTRAQRRALVRTLPRSLRLQVVGTHKFPLSLLPKGKPSSESRKNVLRKELKKIGIDPKAKPR